MPEWVLSALISLAGLAISVGAIGAAWGTLGERVANLKEDVKAKASNESMLHLEKSLGEIKAMLERILHRGGE